MAAWLNNPLSQGVFQNSAAVSYHVQNVFSPCSSCWGPSALTVSQLVSTPLEVRLRQQDLLSDLLRKHPKNPPSSGWRFSIVGCTRDVRVPRSPRHVPFPQPSERTYGKGSRPTPDTLTILVATACRKNRHKPRTCVQQSD